MIKKIKICKITELPAGSAKSVKVFARPIAVFNMDGKVVAFEGFCKHMNAPLVLSGKISGTTLTCGWHGWQYDVASGQCLNKPDVCLKRYDVEVMNEEVFVHVTFGE